jgi:hypothetical protein
MHFTQATVATAAAAAADIIGLQNAKSITMQQTINK